MGKHFVTEITDTTFRFARERDPIDDEALLDGLYGRAPI
jgi:hypothetical protein